MNPEIITYALTVLGAVATILLPLIVPAIRLAVGRYIGGLVQHHFDREIEKLKSDLRRSEDKFSADLRANEQRLKSLSDTALSIQSTRQMALDARRLKAVEKLWSAKIGTDRLKLAAAFISRLDLDKVYKAAEEGDSSIGSFGAALDKLTGIDLKKEAPQLSALSERPFLPPDVWVIFSAYQGVMTHSVMILKALSIGTTEFLKKEDTLKPRMLLALPEFKKFIETYGFSGYYHLLDILEQKLLNTIAEMLDGKAVDDATLKRSVEIISAARELDAEVSPEIPNGLRGSEIPDPLKNR